MEKIIGLKEFRENVDTFVRKVKTGQSFIVVKRSRPIFKVAPVDNDEGEWETVVDFTKIRKGGVSARELLKALRHGQNTKSVKKV